ncbi:exocyst complex component sec3 domain-containing protein [Ditylenchus destructor]|uniref:Exocyst complex component sec3 domain-containing protein n=1 Tax=Ditylenchus destructor TaxID=166010 RepID=A0AAD4R5A8_9BILA|nr:exocyst complex component sec3 domain-containing protein [Ditylenchus destructor]
MSTCTDKCYSNGASRAMIKDAEALCNAVNGREFKCVDNPSTVTAEMLHQCSPSNYFGSDLCNYFRECLNNAVHRLCNDANLDAVNAFSSFLYHGIPNYARVFVQFETLILKRIKRKTNLGHLSTNALMTAEIRSNLQKLVFQPEAERLVAVANLKQDHGSMTPAKKKKKEVFVCLVVTIEQPVMVKLYFVKRSEKDDQLRKKEQYALRDIRVVDGINPRKATPEFNITVAEKQFQLSAGSQDEKEIFIRQLYKLANSYLPVQKPDFINLSLPVETFVAPSVTSSLGQNGREGDANGNGADLADYQPITAKEEADFRRLLAKSNLEVGKARQFATVLNEQLMKLDGANIESIMGSEQHVTDLINLIDEAVEEATRIEKQLDEYDTTLSFVRDSVELIEEKDSLGHIERTNTRRLMQELSDFIYLMDTMNDNHINVLKSADLSDTRSINLAGQAANALSMFLSKAAKTELTPMGAYQERLEAMNKITADFVDRLYSHTSAIFDNMEAMLEQQNLGEIILQKHSQRHHALLPFRDLIFWLKLARPNVYQNVLERYKASAGDLYRKEFERFFAELTHRSNRLWADVKNSATQNSHNADKNAAMFKEYANLLDTAIAECRSVVESEQKFCTRFFHLNSELLASLETQSTGSGDSGSLLGAGGKSLDRQINDNIKAVIGPIFEQVPSHIQKFAAHCKEQHPLVIISMFVVLTKRLNAYQDTSSYFSVLYGSILVGIKRLFDDQMKAMEMTLSHIRIPKRTRVGILETISRFKSWVHASDVIFAQSERRGDLDRWIEKLTDAVIQGINMAAESPNSKYPPPVVRLENLHHLYSTLSELKIPCLDSRRKEVKKQYQENIQVYVREYMGRPLEQVHIFFEQIERAIRQGRKPEEIGYEQQFSRMALKHVISKYPAKEVKRGLDNLYRKVEKHLCNDSPLLQVVWRDMQDEFLKQMKHYQQLLGQCYPAPKIDLEVSIQDVLQFFSEIAQQH